MKTGLEKMVEFLEKSIEMFGGILLTRAALSKANELLEEEKAQNDTRPAVTMRETDLADWKEHKEEFKKWMAQKPTAPASLAEGLCGSCNGSGLVQIAPNVRGVHTCPTCKGKGKMVGIRPAPSCEHIGQYSNNCRYSNNDFKCSLPPKKECVMGFISKCDGTVPPSVRPAPSCEEGAYRGKTTAKSCNCIGPNKCTDMACYLVNKNHPSPEAKAREYLNGLPDKEIK